MKEQLFSIYYHISNRLMATDIDVKCDDMLYMVVRFQDHPSIMVFVYRQNGQRVYFDGL